MDEKNLIIICSTVIICILILCSSILIINHENSEKTSLTAVNKNQAANSTSNQNNITHNTTHESKNSDDNLRYGDTIHYGHKNYSHYGCGGHILYNGEEGWCNKCGAHFIGDYVVDY